MHSTVIVAVASATISVGVARVPQLETTTFWIV